MWTGELDTVGRLVAGAGAGWILFFYIIILLFYCSHHHTNLFNFRYHFSNVYLPT